MKINILAVGNKMPDWVNSGYAAYINRLSHEITVKLIEIKPEKRNGTQQLQQFLNVESKRIRAAIPAGGRLVALDERGKQWTTIEFVNVITEWMREGNDVTFVIGGADGLHQDIKASANELLALSKLTMPHGLARVVLAEQLYRVVSVIKKHPYHRV
ncbi:MAG: 23S rRNA (pseudouridine(1915)-N(3))-methyltransferase RlmH [Betaproteobacteria bacterium]|nr:23S rRNA (pseudouridine(1915)-N(3))-methyltransferase RlmH [Betaproteobacteria bacterium]